MRGWWEVEVSLYGYWVMSFWVDFVVRLVFLFILKIWVFYFIFGFFRVSFYVSGGGCGERIFIRKV